MKRVLIFTLVIGLFAVQADAVVWELDEATALQFTTIAADDIVGTLNISPPYAYYGLQSGMVGFTAELTDDGDADNLVTATISAGGTPTGLPAAAFDGIMSYVENDNEDIWGVQLFYVDSGNTERNSGAFVELGAHTSTYLTVNVAVANLSLIKGMGFRVQGNMLGSLDPSDPLYDSDYPSQGDVFHMSIVPEPATIALLGLGALSLLRRRKK